MRVRLGDLHNGRAVARAQNGWIEKPRPLLWEWLVYGADSPLRQWLSKLLVNNMDFLESMEFKGKELTKEGFVRAIHPIDSEILRAVGLGLVTAYNIGKMTGLLTWLGVTDLHDENVFFTRSEDEKGFRMVAVDIEGIFSDLVSPKITGLIPSDPNWINNEGLSSLGGRLPWESVCALLKGYFDIVTKLNQNSEWLIGSLLANSRVSTTPIRVLLRHTKEYYDVLNNPEMDHHFTEEEQRQLSMGSIPYFFLTLDRPFLQYFDIDGNRNPVTTQGLLLPQYARPFICGPLKAIAQRGQRVLEVGLFDIFEYFTTQKEIKSRYSNCFEYDGFKIVMKDGYSFVLHGKTAFYRKTGAISAPPQDS